MDATRLEQVCRRYNVALLVQFGSTVSGNVHEHSDLDLAALVGGDPASRDARIDLYVDLAPLFPGRDVDLALINTADPLFLKKILEHGRLLYGSSRRFAELRVYAYRRYQDHKRFLAVERRYVKRMLETGAAR
jgi:predicted nucleotidyltransferase